MDRICKMHETGKEILHSPLKPVAEVRIVKSWRVLVGAWR